mmetsp:Transcript_48082/g.127301  ORF Transcript_48082/g.127301 Transcript_48082/m.127301 type:complete len:229 (+) Transcript_48082:409-1095(+)
MRPRSTSERNGDHAIHGEFFLTDGRALQTEQLGDLLLLHQTPIGFLRILVEVVHHPPLVVPNLELCSLQLISKRKIEEIEACELHVLARLYDGLGCAEQRKSTVFAVPGAKLLASNDETASLASSHINAALHGADEDTTVHALINEHGSYMIEQEDVAIVALLNVDRFPLDGALQPSYHLIRLFRYGEVLRVYLRLCGRLLLRFRFLLGLRVAASHLRGPRTQKAQPV